ncbi:hypothetical protein [Kibdelosporangium philippinense]
MTKYHLVGGFIGKFPQVAGTPPVRWLPHVAAGDDQAPLCRPGC